jgi:hypothetical protein
VTDPSLSRGPTTKLVVFCAPAGAQFVGPLGGVVGHAPPSVHGVLQHDGGDDAVVAQVLVPRLQDGELGHSHFVAGRGFGWVTKQAPEKPEAPHRLAVKGFGGRCWIRTSEVDDG